MKYAVIKTGGKQYKVAEGDIIEIERLSVDPNNSITFSDVLLFANGEDAKIGTPLVDGVVVTGKVLDHFRGEKIRVAKYKAKVRYRKVIGHRQELSRVQIDSIGDPKSARTQENAAKKAEVESQVTITEKKPTKKAVKKTPSK